MHDSVDHPTPTVGGHQQSPAILAPLAARVALILLCTLGLILSGVLLRMSTPGGNALLGLSLCSPSSHINCDYVLASPWAKIGTLPTSLVAMIFYAAMLVWFACIGIANSAGRRWHWIPLLGSALAVSVSIYYVTIMATQLPVWCTWCLAAHAVNAAILLVVLMSWPRGDSSGLAYPTAARVAITAGFGACAGLIVLFGVLARTSQIAAATVQQQYLQVTNNIDYIVWQWQKQPRQTIAATPNDFCIGPTKAPHTLVVFTDFECSKCAGFHRYALWLRRRQPDTVRFVYKHYPLCHSCNSYVDGDMHFFACDAACAFEAAKIAGNPRQAIDYFDKLFANAFRLASEPYGELAAACGIDRLRFEKAMADEQARRNVVIDTDLAHGLGVDATPVLFLDGRKLPTWYLLDDQPSPKIDVNATDRLWDRLLIAGPTTVGSDK